MKRKNYIIKIIIVFIIIFCFGLLSCKSNEEKIEIEKNKMVDVIRSIFSEYDLNNIDTNIYLPEEYEGYLLTYKSNDVTVIDNKGVINQGADNKTTSLLVTITNSEMNISITETIEIIVSEVSPITIIEYHSATGIYKVKGIVSAIIHNDIYIEDSTGKNKITIPEKYSNLIKQGDELIITFDDSKSEAIIRVEILSRGNQISKSIDLLDLTDSEKNYYRRINVNDLVVTDIDTDLLDSNNVIITISDSESEKQLSIYNGFINNNEELKNIIKDLEIGDVLNINKVICDDNFLFVEGSSLVITKKNEINYTKINSVAREGTYFIVGKVVCVLANAFIFSDETGNRLIYNPELRPVEEGKNYSIKVEAIYNDNIEIYLDRIKLIDDEIEINNNPIYINGYLVNIILDSPVENNLHVELIGKITEEERGYCLVPYGNDDIHVFFNRKIDEKYCDQNVRVIGYISSVNGRVIDLILDEINLSSEVAITPLDVKIDIDKYEYELFDEIDLKAIIYPDYANYANNVSWELEDDSIIKMDSNGVFRAIGFGKVKVIAKTGNNLIDQVTIEIKNINNAYLAYLLFRNSEFDVKIGNEIDIKPLVDKFNYEFSYDDEIIELNDYKIIGKKIGETDLIITINGVATLKCHVNVNGDTKSGYDISPTEVYKDVITVRSRKEFNDALLFGFLNRYNKINIRFDYFVESSNPVDLIDISFYEIGKVEFNTYYIDKGRTVQAIFIGLDEMRGTIETIDPTYNDDTILYINELLEHYALYNKRSSDYNDFKIYNYSIDYVDVRTTQELFLMIEKGYAPSFPLHSSTAERVFEQSKEILRNIITDDMNDYLKVKAIYDYIVLNCELDKKATLSKEANLKSNDLEGAFSGLASEEGLAKMFVLMCRIEGIEASMVKGENRFYSKCWNIVTINDVDYLVSLGDGIESSKNDRSITELFPVGFSYINYSYFLKDSTMFRDTYPNITRGRDTIDTQSYNVFKDELIYNSKYDYQISSQEELNYLFNLIYSFDFGRDYYIYISSYNYMIGREKIQKALDFAKSTDRFVVVDFTTNSSNKLYGVFVKVGKNG